MGSCDSSNGKAKEDYNKLKNVNSYNQSQANKAKNVTIENYEKNQNLITSNYRDEVQINNAIVPLKNYIKASEAVCKITIKKNNANATGFFLEISSLKCLLTNYHVISKDLVDTNSEIEIETYSKIKVVIQLNKNERYIKYFEKPKDITVIQINNSDEINKYIKFLQYDLNYSSGYQIYKNVDIFALEHPRGNDVGGAAGKIIRISNYEFYHNIDTDIGSSGSPIILSSNLKVVGIHKGGILAKK